MMPIVPRYPHQCPGRILNPLTDDLPGLKWFPPYLQELIDAAENADADTVKLYQAWGPNARELALESLAWHYGKNLKIYIPAKLRIERAYRKLMRM